MSTSRYSSTQRRGASIERINDSSTRDQRTSGGNRHYRDRSDCEYTERDDTGSGHRSRSIQRSNVASSSRRGDDYVSSSNKQRSTALTVGSGDPQPNLSSFYRDRFGSHSPEEYLNLRLSHMDPRLSKDEIKTILEKEFDAFAPFEIKIVRNPNDDQRLAYVNFQRPEAARKIRRTLMSRLTRSLGHRLHVDPAGVIRDQEGKYIPDRYNRAMQAERERRPVQTLSPSSNRYSNRRRDTTPPSVIHRSSKSNIDHHNRDTVTLSSTVLPAWKLDECVHDAATRTLFIGNLPTDVKDSEIKRVFGRHGKIEDIDIKSPADTSAPYAFVQFENVEQAMTAKHYEQDRPIRPHASRNKIGYGKPIVSTRLYVGGLGAWISTDTLNKEFDRYGLIEKIEYEKGSDHAYVRFADSTAASDACRAMRGFPLGGHDNCIIVDFSKDPRASDNEAIDNHRKRRRSGSIEGSDEMVRSADHHRGSGERRKRTKPHTPPPRKGPQTPPDSPPPSPRKDDHRITITNNNNTATPDGIRVCKVRATNIEQLESAISPCWTGAIVLKKAAYAIRLHKLTGSDDLIDSELRDANGESIRLQVSQRLPFANQTSLIDKFAAASADQLAYLIAVGNSSATSELVKLADSPTRPLIALVNYLNEKNAAGVVSLASGAILYVFPHCELARAMLAKAAPDVDVMGQCTDGVLLLALSRNTSTSASSKSTMVHAGADANGTR